MNTLMKMMCCFNLMMYKGPLRQFPAAGMPFP